MSTRDANLIETGTVLETDICIIGAGAAGISMAHEFLNSTQSVCLLESGSETFQEAAQSLYRGENLGTFPEYQLEQPRMRVFGGTTTLWSGNCRPLDPWDFENRPWVPNSGWPITREQLDPFYQRAQLLCELGPYNYNTRAWADLAELPPLPLDGHRVVTTIFQASPPTNFAKRYGPEISRAGNIGVYLNATLLDLHTVADGQRVSRATIATPDGRRFTVSAKAYVLATGGIENARLLLGSDSDNPAGIGNQNDCVGRYFMEHPETMAGEILSTYPNRDWGLYRYRTQVNSTRIKGTLMLSGPALETEKIGGLSLQPKIPTESDAVASSDYLLRRLRDGDLPDHLSSHLANVWGDRDNVLISVYEKLVKTRSVLFSFSTHAEQYPYPDNRVTLSDERDPFGKRRAKLNARLHEADLRTIRRGTEIFAIELARSGVGRLRSDYAGRTDEEIEQMQHGLHHQMGTTRMHTDPRQGVVNENCRVHGLDNLYVAGGSVFPTGGMSNPTLTIVALALRLADHLKVTIGNEAAP